ncbi:MAG: response regulator [Deltaproteobacteria bacterium]|nr:response regulator [Deltaproteobacteria bacterium]
MLDDRWLAEQLRAHGLINAEQLTAAQSAGGHLARALISLGVISETALLRFLGLTYKTRFISAEKLSQAKIQPRVLALLSVEFCQERIVLPVRCSRERELSVVTPTPSDAALLAAIENTAQVQSVKGYVALPDAVEAAIRKWYLGDIHAFSRLPTQAGQTYSQILDTYDQRLIDFDSDPDNSPRSVKSPSRRVLTTGPVRQVRPTGPMRAFSAPTRSGAEADSQPTAAFDQNTVAALTAAVVPLIDTSRGTHPHSADVGELMAEIALRRGLDAATAARFKIAGYLHDIGKPTDPHLTILSVDHTPKLRQAALAMHTAPSMITADARLGSEITQIWENQYEKYGGGGIPGRLQGEGIPFGARLLAACDVICNLLEESGSEAINAIDVLRTAAKDGFLDPEAVGGIAAVLDLPKIKRSAATRPASVLIVDPEASATALPRLVLANAGFTVTNCSTTAEAARHVLAAPPDAIITEIPLSPVDGFGFVERLRANASTRHTPVLFVSRHSDALSRQRSAALGAFVHLEKPVEIQELVDHVSRAVATTNTAPTPAARGTGAEIAH